MTGEQDNDESHEDAAPGREAALGRGAGPGGAAEDHGAGPGGSAGLPDEDWARVIGHNVRRLRAGAGISLADLATAGGVSKTTLHGIELGHGNPTMSTLWALATALHVPLGELLEASSPAVEITRSGDDRPRASGDAVSARLLHRIRLRGTVEVYDIGIAPAAQHSQAHLPGVEECMVITRGQVITGPADDPAELAERDSIRFGAARPHVYRGAGPDNRAVLLMIYPEP